METKLLYIISQFLKNKIRKIQIAMTVFFLIFFHGFMTLINNFSTDLAQTKFQPITLKSQIVNQNKSASITICVKNQACVSRINEKGSLVLKFYVQCPLNYCAVDSLDFEKLLRNFSMKTQLCLRIKFTSIKFLAVQYGINNDYMEIIAFHSFLDKKQQLLLGKKTYHEMFNKSKIKIEKCNNDNFLSKGDKQKILKKKLSKLTQKNEIIQSNILIYQKRQSQVKLEIEKKLEHNKKGFFNERNLQTTSPNTSALPKEFIKNGDFSNTPCTEIYCIYYKPSFKPQYIAFWQPLPEIEVGRASFFHDSRPPGKAASVSGDHTTCFRQLVQNLTAGVYELSFRFSAQNIYELRIQSLLVFLNDTQVYRKLPPSYDFINVTVSNISIVDDNNSVYIKFCGDPAVQSAGGAVVYNVSFKLIAEYPKPQPILPANSTNTTNSANTTTNTSNNFQTLNNSQTFNDSQNSTIDSNSSKLNISTNNSKTENSSHQTVDNDNINKLFESILQKRPNATFYDLLTDSELMETWQNFNRSQKNLNFFGFKFNFLLQVNVTAIVDVAIKIPIVKQLFRSYFCFFINLDHLWLYIYHQREYGVYIKRLLVQIHIFQEEKWNFLTKDMENQLIHLPNIRGSLNQKIKQSSKHFIQIEGNSRQFFVNTLQYFIINVPMMLAAFFAVKLLYIFLKNFGLQQVLKDFELNSIIILILLEGNSEPFVYLLVSDLLMLFAFGFKVKLMNVVVLLILFSLVFVLIASPFILRSLYERKKQVEFYPKSKNTLKGAVFFMVEFGLFNIMVGCVHLLCENKPNFQLACLLVLQFGFLLYLLTNFDGKKVYNLLFEIWIMILTCFTRILLIVSYFWFQLSSGSVKEMVENVQLAYVILYLSLWMVSIFHGIISQITEIIYFPYHRIMTKCRQLNNQNRRKGVLNKKMIFSSFQNSQLLEFREEQNLVGQGSLRLNESTLTKEKKFLKKLNTKNTKMKSEIKEKSFKFLRMAKTKTKLSKIAQNDRQLDTDIQVINKIDTALNQIEKIRQQLVNMKANMSKKNIDSKTVKSIKFIKGCKKIHPGN